MSVWFEPICFQPTEHQSFSLLFLRRWTAARSEDSPSWSPSASSVFCCSSKLQLVCTGYASVHTAYHPRVWLVCQEFKHVLFLSLDMKNFQQLLKRGDDEETMKGCTERDERGNKDAERGQTPCRRHSTMLETRTENAPTQDYQVRHSIILTLQVLEINLQKEQKIQTIPCVCSSTAVYPSSRACFRTT